MGLRLRLHPSTFSTPAPLRILHTCIPRHSPHLQAVQLDNQLLDSQRPIVLSPLNRTRDKALGSGANPKARQLHEKVRGFTL